MWQFSLPMMQFPHATHKFVSHLVSWDEDVEIGISINIKNNKLRRKNSTQRQHNIKVVNFVSMVHIRSHLNFYYLRNFFFRMTPSPSFYLRWGPEDLIICFGVIWLSDKLCPRTEAINKLPRLGPYHQLKQENINVTQDNILLQPQHITYE